MKAVILAGGLGTRISEETHLKPKPMIEIGDKPILWHIMKICSMHGINEFIICLGYKGYIIKEYFANYVMHMSDVTIDMENNQVKIHKKAAEPWKVTLVDTGADTMTGGRVKRLASYLKDEPFLLTYGDGVGDVDITALVEFHKNHGKYASITAVAPPGRFGALEIVENSRVRSFQEKPAGDGGLINGGFFILEPQILDYIKDDTSIWERAPLEQLASDKQLHAYKHFGFWQPMDTLRDMQYLEELYRSGKAPWVTW